MIKKITIFLLSIIFSFILLEITFQVLPYIYKNLPKINNNIYICVIGESISYGHPYQGKINFAKVVSELVNRKIDGKNVEIVCLAGDGDNLYLQYKKYLVYKLLHPLRKNIIFGYFGMGYTFPKNNNSKFNLLKFRLLDFLFFKNNFEYEYEKILNIIKKYGDEVYISTIVGNYSGVMPNNVNSLIKNKTLEKELKNIDYLILNEEYNYAIQQTNNLINNYEDKCQILYRIGKIYEKQNKIKEANEVYKKMIDDKDRRPTIEENNIIKMLAKKYQIELIDIDSDLEKKNEIIGYNYFIDIVHPTIDFNMFIAQKFVEKLQKKHLIDCYSDYDIREKILYAFSDQDWFIAYRDALGEILLFSYRKNFFDVYTKEQISKYISKLYELNNKIKETDVSDKREEIIHICEVLFEYIQGNKDKTIELINKYNLKDTILRRDRKKEKRMQGWWYMKHWLIDFIFKNKI